MSQCSSLECTSTAVARSLSSGQHYCIECAIKIQKQHGPSILETLPGAKFPWEEEGNITCPHCGGESNTYLTGFGGECPRCRKDLLAPKGPYRYDEVKVKYEEGQHD